MTAGGLEIPIGKVAISAIGRVAPVIRHKSVMRKKLKETSYLIETSEIGTPTLTPEQATAVNDYVTSRDFHIVAVQNAMSQLERKHGHFTSFPIDTLTCQIRAGLKHR